MSDQSGAELAALLQSIVSAAIDAGRIALKHRAAPQSSRKGDGSPVTAADLECDAMIRKRLQKFSSFPVLSEETADGERLEENCFWVVDPLDGTKEFIKGSGEFTVNIALVDGDSPVLGVVHAPVLALTYYARRGGGAFRLRDASTTRISTGPPASPLRVAISRDHVGSRERELLDRIGDAATVPMGSSLKFCLIAEGAADLYPRFGRTMEWDTAAAQCVLEEAGGCVLDESHRPLRYGKPAHANPSFIAGSDPSLVASVLRNA